jgi:hypothetical protein
LHNYGEDCGWEPSSATRKWVESDFKDDPRYRGHGRWQFDTYNAGEPEKQYQLIDDLDSPPWRGLTEEQVKSLTGLFPGETVWTGVSDHADGSNNFCGGLDTDDVNWFLHPDKCSSAINLGSPPDNLVEKLESLYRISITTGNKSGAGTDAYVFIELTSDSGQLHLDGTFEKGDVDVFHVGSRTSDLGELHTVKLWHDGSGDDPPWLVKKISVQNKVTGEEWVWSSDDGTWVQGADKVEFPLTAQ